MREVLSQKTEPAPPLQSAASAEANPLLAEYGTPVFQNFSWREEAGLGNPSVPYGAGELLSKKFAAFVMGERHDRPIREQIPAQLFEQVDSDLRKDPSSWILIFERAGSRSAELTQWYQRAVPENRVDLPGLFGGFGAFLQNQSASSMDIGMTLGMVSIRFHDGATDHRVDSLDLQGSVVRAQNMMLRSLDLYRHLPDGRQLHHALVDAYSSEEKFRTAVLNADRMMERAIDWCDRESRRLIINAVPEFRGSSALCVVGNAHLKAFADVSLLSKRADDALLSMMVETG